MFTSNIQRNKLSEANNSVRGILFDIFFLFQSRFRFRWPWSASSPWSSSSSSWPSSASSFDVAAAAATTKQRSPTRRRRWTPGEKIWSLVLFFLDFNFWFQKLTRIICRGLNSSYYELSKVHRWIGRPTISVDPYADKGHSHNTLLPSCSNWIPSP